MSLYLGWRRSCLYSKVSPVSESITGRASSVASSACLDRVRAATGSAAALLDRVRLATGSSGGVAGAGARTLGTGAVGLIGALSTLGGHGVSNNHY